MRLILLIGLVLHSVFRVSAQRLPGDVKRNETPNERNERMIEESFKQLRKLEGQTAGKSNRSSLPHNIPEPQLSKEQRIMITPAKEDLNKYEDFLKSPHTGIFKMLSAPACGNKLVVDVNNEKCLNRPLEHLSYYSFRKLQYADLAWSDLNYEENRLLVGFEKMSIGLISEIGDVSLETLGKDSPKVRPLIKLEMPQNQNEIQSKKEEIKKGILLNSLKFSNQAEAKLNRTYLLRSYAYRAKGDAFNDKRIDIIVAFKVVRVDDNKSLTIIWKEIFKGKSVKF